MAVLSILDHLELEERASLDAAMPVATTLMHVDRDPDALAAATILLSRHQRIDAALLEMAPLVRAVIKIDSYLGEVDLVACEQRGIVVHRVPAVSILSVAEHAIMFMLALEKRSGEAERRLRADIRVGAVQPALTTQDSYAYNWVGLEQFGSLYGRRVGIVGMGTIGRAVAERLIAFGCEVLITTGRPLAAEHVAMGMKRVPFEELLATADHVSLHLRADPANVRMMGEPQFQMMRPGSFFINTARGALVDEAALVSALVSGRLAGAALDVFEYEPLQLDSRLRSTPNTILTPHTAGVPAGNIHPAEIPRIADIVARYIDGS